MTILIGLIVVSFIILIHELGHYIACRQTGVDVYEFSIGFGPDILNHHGRSTEFHIRMIPFGGYVRLNPYEDEKSKGQQFESQSWMKQIYVLFSGSLANWLIAGLVLISMYVFIGMPQGVGNRIDKVYSDTPARSVLMKQDEIIRINGVAVSTGEAIIRRIRESGGQMIQLDIIRNGQNLTFQLTPSKGEGRGYYSIGVRLAPMDYLKIPLLTAINKGVSDTVSLTLAILKGLGAFVASGFSLRQISGPLGIVSLAGEMVNYGMLYVVRFCVAISINIAILNLLPIPALDGGRIGIVLLERLLNRKFNPELVQRIHGIGLILLMTILIYITYNDVIRILNGS